MFAVRICSSVFLGNCFPIARRKTKSNGSIQVGQNYNTIVDQYILRQRRVTGVDLLFIGKLSAFCAAALLLLCCGGCVELLSLSFLFELVFVIWWVYDLQQLHYYYYQLIGIIVSLEYTLLAFAALCIYSLSTFKVRCTFCPLFGG